MNPIYLDNNSTTPIDPRVLSAMNDILLNCPGNPSSVHSYGQKTRQKLIQARDTIAACLGVSPKELVFTSGATEAINMAIRSFFETSPKGHLITSDLEHEAVYQTIKQLEKQGCSVTYLKGGNHGAVSPESVQAAIRPDTKLIALIGVNNETGVKTDIDAIAQIAREARIPLFIDAVAMLGKERINIPEGVSSMCFSGHKIHAPQGIGLLFMRKQFKIVPLLHGGSQESGRRAGTENMAGIVGLAKAFELLDLELPEAARRMEALRDHFEHALTSHLAYISINGQGPRTCNTSNLAFKGVDGEALLARLDLEGVAVSLGSACTSGALEPSRVLLNMGIPPEIARSSIRFSLSRMTTREEIDRAIAIILKELIPNVIPNFESLSI